MSRNGNGTYNLPAGNPVVTGTTISSTWANNTLADMANAITGSIAADGQTTITGPLKGTNGTVTFAGTGQTQIPAGTTAQRSSTPVDGMIRYNTDLNVYEGYRNSSWLPLISANADSIVYNEGDSGAVDRTVESKLQESISVKDFGAVGDGITNDTVAFQAAAAAINAAGGGKLIIPAGTYIVGLQYF
ncbi:MAG: glycosyl hydrolase family 28-related protein, partial [Verrucomicrobiota bacterium]